MKRSMRVRRAVAGALVVGLALVGCSTGNETPTATTGSAGGSTGGSAGKADCTVGMTQINQTAVFFTQMNEGATQAAKDAGCDLSIANANNDSAKQNSDIETFVSQGVTGLIVVAIDVNGVLPAVKAARDKGIKVVAIDAKLEEGSVDTFVGVDNAKAGEAIGKWVVDNGLAAGKSYGVVDAKNSFIQNQREDAFRKTVDAAGATYTQSVNGDNVQEKAAAAAQNLVTAQPNLDWIYTTGEPATVGAAAALKGNTVTKIVGWDLTKEVIGAIDSGLAVAVVQQNPKQEGVEAVQELKSLIDGGTAKGFIDVPITIVTKDNVEPFRSVFP
ncbi:substrate-binding domain-containing protein [Georgenia sp. SYP-B2076]|uniref:substrate-binding domain-containing protein n=1 Tax=Georgenia sp. SYP-B2076 TaxID=2495881 RepID=UPI000F8D83B0|nr:substrate-binding domain-containing protein [Georgenia sp. SYP-B2076]